MHAFANWRNTEILRRRKKVSLVRACLCFSPVLKQITRRSILSYFLGLVTAMRFIYGRPKFRIFRLFYLGRFLEALLVVNCEVNRNASPTKQLETPNKPRPKITGQWNYRYHYFAVMHTQVVIMAVDENIFKHQSRMDSGDGGSTQGESTNEWQNAAPG